MRTLALLLTLGLATTAVAQDHVNPALAAEWDLTEPGLYAIFETSMGDFVGELFEDQVPGTVANFVDLATGDKPWRAVDKAELIQQIQREGNVRTQAEALARLEELTQALPVQSGPLYDGTIFHRVIPEFMIQGGSPTGTGSGGPGFTIEDEFDPNLLHDQAGRLSMANVGRPDTGSCQFFVTVAPTPWLDYTHPANRERNAGHAVFGQVIRNLEVPIAISEVERDANDGPLEEVTLESVTIVRVPEAAAAPAPETTAAPASAE